jgi:hypothetical protein
MFRSYMKYCLVTVVTLSTLGAATLRADTLVFSENFESTTVALDVTTAGAFSAIGGSNVDVVGTADNYGFLCAGPESGACVDMSGSGGDSVGQIDLTNPLNLAAGVYELSFDLVGSGRGDTTMTTVAFGDYLHTFTLASGDITSGIVVDALVNVSGGPTQLTFTDDSPNDNIGALLDNVSISSVSAVTTSAVAPEPSSLMLFGTGMLGVAGMLRRKLFA